MLPGAPLRTRRSGGGENNAHPVRLAHLVRLVYSFIITREELKICTSFILRRSLLLLLGPF